jgi:serine/threonine protein kinase
MWRSSDGSAVLIDFGLARTFISGRTDSITDLGTVGYAPIEQYKRQGKFGPYTDVYALAATLYYLRTGKSPIPANFRDELNIPLPEPKQQNPQIADWENAAILKGMELQPTNRPQTVAEWLKLLGIGETPGATTFTFDIVKVNDRGKEIPPSPPLEGGNLSRRQGQAKQIVEDLGNGVTLEMVLIPGGTFIMGSPAGEGRDWEKPQHQVTINPS